MLVNVTDSLGDPVVVVALVLGEPLAHLQVSLARPDSAYPRDVVLIRYRFVARVCHCCCVNEQLQEGSC